MLKTSTARLLTLCALGILGTGCVSIPDNGYYDAPTPVYGSGGVLYGPGGYAPEVYPVYPVYPSTHPLYRDNDDRRRWQNERERQAWREREQQQRLAEQRREHREREARQRDHRNDQAREQREREDARRQQQQREQHQRDRHSQELRQQQERQRQQQEQYRHERGDRGYDQRGPRDERENNGILQRNY